MQVGCGRKDTMEGGTVGESFICENIVKFIVAVVYALVFIAPPWLSDIALLHNYTQLYLSYYPRSFHCLHLDEDFL